MKNKTCYNTHSVKIDNYDLVAFSKNFYFLECYGINTLKFLYIQYLKND